MRILKTYFIAFIFIISCVFIYPNIALSKEPHAPASDEKEDIYKHLELFADAITIVDVNYVDEIEPKDLMYGALKGMLRSLDEHSDFLTPEQYEEIKIDTGGEFGGLGIEITIADDLLTIVTPLEDTPAHRAGLMPNDKIIRIDGASTKDFSLDDTVKMMRGRPGTKVTLTIMREGEEGLQDYTLKRAIIKIESVKEALILEDGIGYIRITDFQQRTAQDLEKALRQLKKDKLSGFILDLRNNPGGLLDASTAIAEKFLPMDTVIVSIRGRIQSQQEIFKATSPRPYLDFPMVVLVNKGSASASEIVAAAIKDNKRGILVGTPTFGKASVQTIIPMRDGSAIRLTTSKYYTPSGEQIYKVGVIPNVIVERIRPIKEQEKEENIFSKLERNKKANRVKRLKQDNQVQSALELLKGINIYESLSNK